MKRYFLFLQKFFAKILRPWRSVPRPMRILTWLAIVVVGLYWIITHPIYHASEDGTPANKSDAQLASKTGNLTKGTPEYKTYVPAGKTIDSLGGWTRVSPPDRNPVYAFSDKLYGTPINVSQQPLPKDFKPDTADQVAELAKGYHADHFITVNSNKVYIGTSAKGPQSVILAKNDTLILIKSSAKLSDDQWTAYVDSLQ